MDDDADEGGPPERGHEATPDDDGASADDTNSVGRPDVDALDDAVICFPLRSPLPLAPDDELLLIYKKRGIGADLYNGPGGKVEPGETPREAAIRETREEVGLEVRDVERRAVLEFFFDEEPLFRGHVYVATEYEGTATETAEAAPEWRRRAEIPYDEMWEDDRLWLPDVLDGATVEGWFRFDADGDELIDWALSTDGDLAGR